MARSVKDQLDDAKAIANRAQTRLVVIGGGLLLMWAVTFEPGNAVLRVDRSQLGLSLVQAEKLQVLSKIVASNRIATEKTIARDQRRLKLVCADPMDTARCKTAGEALHAVERARGRLQAQQSRLAATLKSKEAKVRAIQDRLSERVAFDIGEGFKLPFSLLDAPLAWLSLLAVLLGWIGIQRARFWSIVAKAWCVGIAASDPLNETMIVEAPLWLAPVPSRSRGCLPDEAQLAIVVGWRHCSSRNTWVVRGLLALTALLTLRIAILASAFSFTVADTKFGSDGLTFAIPTPFLIWPIAAVTVVILIELLWLALPHRLSKYRATMMPEHVGRRKVLTAVSASVVAAVAGGLGLGLGLGIFDNQIWSTLVNGIRRKTTYYNKRVPRFSDLSSFGLKSGWYENIRSGNIHFVSPTGQVRGVNGLKASNLKLFDVGDPKVSTGFRDDQNLPTSWLLDEARAIALLEARNPDGALKALVSWWQTYPVIADQRTLGYDLRRFDLAAGLAIRSGNFESLNRLAEVTRLMIRQLPNDRAVAELHHRLDRWFSSEHRKWRMGRWSPHRPISWGGRLYLA